MHEAWFFVGVFAFIFLVWLASGGPARGIPIGLPSYSFQNGSTTSAGNGFGFSLPTAPFPIGTSHVTLRGYPSSEEGGSAILDGVSYGTFSSYGSVVSLSHSVSAAGAGNPGDESVTLRVTGDADVPVDITGWTLTSEATGATSVIPQGTDVPTSGIVNAVSDIVLAPGDRAVIISGRSPIGGSFKENKCIGYFSAYQTFSPSLPSNCPDPLSEFKTYYEGSYVRDSACYDYVNKLSSCEASLSPPVGLSGTCQSFLIKYLNYNGCVAAHQHDRDFEGTTWRVYLGRTTSMWRARNEVVKLLDRKGNTVDAFTY